MGYDLYNNNIKYFRFNFYWWKYVLTIAINYGWKPKGTINDEDNWESMDYVTNSAQIVEEDDAKNLAKALRSSMIDIPSTRIVYNSMEKINSYDEFRETIINHFNKELSNDKEDFVEALAVFSGPEAKNYLHEFIEFCEEGGFSIY